MTMRLDIGRRRQHTIAVGDATGLIWLLEAATFMLWKIVRRGAIAGESLAILSGMPVRHRDSKSFSSPLDGVNYE